MMGSITILPGSGDPNALAPNTLPTNALAPISRRIGPGGSADAVTNAPATPPFTLTPVDYDPYALTPSGLVDVTQPFGLNDPARFDASAPGWSPFPSATPAPSLASPTPAPGSASGVASGEDSTFAPGWDSGSAPGLNFGLAPGSFSGLAPSWGSTAAPPSPSQPPSPATGVGDTMDQVEGGGPAAAGNTDFFGRPLNGRGLDDFKQVGRDVLNKAANGLLLGFAPRVGAAFDTAVGRAPTYDAALASRNADQAQADADMGPIAPIVEMAGGALPPWILLSDGLEGLTLGRRLLAHTGIGGGIGAVYGAGASPDLTNLAQTLHAMARSAAMGGVLGMGLPYVVPLAAGLAGAAGHTAAGGADAFSGFGATLFDHGASADAGAPGGAYTGRRYDPETGLTHDRATVYSPSLGRFLQADPIGTQGNVSLYDYVGNDPANLIDPLGTASLSTSTSGSIGGLGQSIGNAVSSYLSDSVSSLSHGVSDYESLIANDPREALHQAVDSAIGVAPELASLSEGLYGAEGVAAAGEGSTSATNVPGPHSTFETAGGLKGINTTVTADEFSANLQANGYTATTTTGPNGPVTVLQNGQGSTYTTYTRTSTGASGAQYIGPSGQVLKYNLGR